MTRDTHDEARKLIALGESLSDAQQVWLRSHVIMRKQSTE
jgi:hypothetical protein